jgi:hypothetical protein
MPDSQELHAQKFNRLGRIVGVAFVVGGIFFIVGGAALMLDKSAVISIDGRPTHDIWMKAIFPAIGLVTSTIGILLLCAKPYRRSEKNA